MVMTEKKKSVIAWTFIALLGLASVGIGVFNWYGNPPATVGISTHMDLDRNNPWSEIQINK